MWLSKSRSNRTKCRLEIFYFALGELETVLQQWRLLVDLEDDKLNKARKEHSVEFFNLFLFYFYFKKSNYLRRFWKSDFENPRGIVLLISLFKLNNFIPKYNCQIYQYYSCLDFSSNQIIVCKPGKFLFFWKQTAVRFRV